MSSQTCPEHHCSSSISKNHFSFTKEEEPNNMNHRNSRKSSRRISALSMEPKKSIEQDNSVELQAKSPTTHYRSEAHGIMLHGFFSAPMVTNTDVVVECGALAEDSGRERLKRHRNEVAGHVFIPDKWGKEELLKDWIDYSSFDALLAPGGIMSAREALVAEGRRASARGLRIKSSC